MIPQIKTVAVILFALAFARADVVITELHRDPAAGNKNAVPGGYSHSFIELVNFGSDTFFLRDVFLTNGKVVDSVTLFDEPVAGHDGCVFDAAYIPPGRVAVILPQNYPVGLEIAPATIHPIAPGTITLTVNHRSIGGGMANDDGVAVYRGTRSRIDSLIDLAADPGVYVSAPLSGKIVLSARQTKGISVVPASLLLGERRYIPSPREPLSPGRYESFQNGLYAEYSAMMISAGSVRCSVAGIFAVNNSQNAAWRLYSGSTTNNSVTEISSGTFNPSSQYNLLPDNSRDIYNVTINGAPVPYKKASTSPQYLPIDLSISNPNAFLLTFDIALERRQYFFEIKQAPQSSSPPYTLPIDLSPFWADGGTLRITEIYPKGGSAAAGQPEWFELLNVSPAEVNMNGWMFGNSKDTVTVTTSDFFLPPNDFLVICKDSAAMRAKYRAIRNLIRPPRWHTLNSYNDTLVVWSPRGVEIDMAAYRSAWFVKWTTQSLERVDGGKSGADSASWVLCDRPTPGGPGGADAWRAVASPSIEIGPTPFSPNGDGKDDLLSIRIKAPPDHRVKIRIFAFSGKLLKTFTDEREVIYWDGKTDGGRPAAPGVIYVVAEFTAGGTKKVLRERGVLWR